MVVEAAHADRFTRKVSEFQCFQHDVLSPRSPTPGISLLLGKNGEPPRNRTGNLQIKSLVPSVVTRGQGLSLLTKKITASQEYARLIRFLTQIDTRRNRVETAPSQR